MVPIIWVSDSAWLDLTLSFWTEQLGYAGVLDPYPAVQHCLDLVRKRPKVKDKFDEMEIWSKEYGELQARGEGVK